MNSSIEITHKKDYFGKALSRIEDGIKGYNNGIPLPNSLSRLDRELCGVQKNTYYLLAARLKVGKTALADSIFLYNSYDYYKTVQGTEDEFPLDIDYYSFEIDTPSKILKGISRKILLDHKLFLPVKYILSKGKFTVKDEHYQMVVAYRKYFEELEDVLTIHDNPVHPTGVNAQLYNKALAKGNLLEREITVDNKGSQAYTYKQRVGYEPSNPLRHPIVIVDHAALTKKEKSMNTKETIDTLSNYLKSLRNDYGYTVVLIQQLGSWGDENQSKFKRGTPVPTLDSFSDSKYTPRDANVIMALHDPYNYMHITKEEYYRGYPVNHFKDNFRGLEIMRNRDGAPNTHLGLGFFGGIGEFVELPNAEYFHSDEEEEYKIAKGYLDYSTKIDKHYENARNLMPKES